MAFLTGNPGAGGVSTTRPRSRGGWTPGRWPAWGVGTLALLLPMACEVPEDSGLPGPEAEADLSAIEAEPLPPVPSPGPPTAESGSRTGGRPFTPDRGPDGVPSRWRAPGELGPTVWPDEHPMALRGGGPRPDPLPPRDMEGRPLYRIDSLALGDDTEEVRSDLYVSPPAFPAAFHTYLPTGFAVDEIGTPSGHAVRFVDGRAPGGQGPPAVNLFLFRGEVSADSADAVAEDIANSRATLEAEEGPPIPWARHTFAFESHTQEGWVAVGNLGGRPLIWMFQTPAARRSDFETKVDLILSTWRWAGGDRPFSEPLLGAP